MPLVYFVFFAALAAVFYILIGYPLLLALVPFKPWRPPVAKDPRYTAAVSVVMAVYNGAEFIRAKLESILALDYPRDLMEIIVVSDGSSDATEPVVREFASRGVQLISIPHAGKAAALNAAFLRARSEIVFFTDVRQMLDPAALRHLVANFADPSVGAVTGQMHLMKGRAGEQADMDLYWRYEVWARRRHSRIDSLFSATGCIYAMRRSLVVPLPADTLTDDAVLPLNAFFQGYRVVFDPAAIAIDHPAKAGTEFRRRWRTLAGMYQVFARMPQLFTSRNRMRFHFLSHKFSRLVLPWALLAATAASFALPASAARNWIISAEGGLLALALADVAIPHWLPLKRLTSPARTLLTMNIASIAALAVFFTSPEGLWSAT